MDASTRGNWRVRLRPWRQIACCAVICACDWASAADAPARCEADLPQGHVMGSRGEIMAAFEQLPDSCLKSLLMACSESANRQFMDLNSAAMCSMAYEALLKQSFGGSFHAFMEWWRSEQLQAR